MTGRAVRRSAVAAVAALGIVQSREPPPAIDAPSVSTAGEREPDSGPAGATAAAPEIATPPLPASLRGTDIPGGFAVDDAGHFRATPDALELFEYFFSASGEEPEAQIRQRIEAEIRARLAPPAREEALAFLDAHLRYREQARALFAAGFEELPVEVRFQRIRELRRSVFGAADAEVLFGAEEDRIRVELERRRVAGDPALAPDERASQLAALEERLPAEVREAQAAARAALDLRREEASLRAQGAGDAEIHALRAQRFGPEAAERLAALDRERAAWQARVTEWQTARETLERELASDPSALAAALDTARAERFSEPEQLRVQALEVLHTASETR